jgi:hypothetical protein
MPTPLPTENRSDFSVGDAASTAASVINWFGGIVQGLPTPRLYLYTRGGEHWIAIGAQSNIGLSGRLQLVGRALGGDTLGRAASRFLPSLTLGGGFSIAAGEVLSHISLTVGLPSMLDRVLRQWQSELTVSGKPQITFDVDIKFEARDAVKTSDPTSAIDSSVEIGAGANFKFNGGDVLRGEIVYTSASRNLHVTIDGKPRVIVLEQRTTSLQASSELVEMLGGSGPSLKISNEFYAYDFSNRRPVEITSDPSTGRVYLGKVDITPDVEALGERDIVVNGYRPKAVPSDLVVKTADGREMNYSRAISREKDPATGTVYVARGARGSNDASSLMEIRTDGTTRIQFDYPAPADGLERPQDIFDQRADGHWYDKSGNRVDAALGKALSSEVKSAERDNDRYAAVTDSRWYSIEGGRAHQYSDGDRRYTTVAKHWIEKVAQRKNHSWQYQERRLELHILPAWRDRKIVDIRRADVRALLDGLEGVVLPNRVRALVKTIFRYALSQDWIDFSPAEGVRKPQIERERDRVLTMSDVAQIWKAAELLGIPSVRTSVS